jgi:hypothetical protein
MTKTKKPRPPNFIKYVDDYCCWQCKHITDGRWPTDSHKCKKYKCDIHPSSYCDGFERIPKKRGFGSYTVPYFERK